MNSTESEDSYILREYFKGFKPDQIELMKLKNKITKIDREMILDSIVKQDKDIYDLIAENYSATFEIFDKLSDQINKLNICLNVLKDDNTTLMYSFRYVNINIDEDKNHPDKEPSSLRQINSNITDNSNKIQYNTNEILAMNNIIENYLAQIQIDENYINDIDKEKEFYVESLNSDKLNEIFHSGHHEIYQTTLIKIVLNYIFIGKKNTQDQSTNASDDDSEQKRSALFKEFKRHVSNKFDEFKQLLKQSVNIFSKLQYDLLREINQQLDNIKSEVEKKGRENYEQFFYLLYKSLKSIIFISMAKNKINKMTDFIEKKREEIENFNQKNQQLHAKNNRLEKLKREILNKYQHKIGGSFISSNSELQKKLRDAKPKRSSNGDNKGKESITMMKLLLNDMETNYITLLKNLSKKVLKPKGLIRKQDLALLVNKIK